MRASLLCCVSLLSLLSVLLSASPAVAKTNGQKVYMHYMPWFETPATNGGQWGYHWKMSRMDPNHILPNGQRDIASYYYPTIGPYATGDPVTIEYHLLLLKYAGVDGILFDWYGNGGNDLPQMLVNVNKMIPVIEKVGLQFAIVFEDRFDGSVGEAQQNMAYLGNTYFNHPNYIQVKGKPLVLNFGPINFHSPADWTTILSVLPRQPTIQALAGDSGQIGNGAGEFVWIYKDFIPSLTNFYNNLVPGLTSAGGVGYPGYNAFYAAGGGSGPSDWTINVGTDTLGQTLDLAQQNAGRIDFVQLATFNDWGEGTMFEPSVQFGNQFLNRIQQYTGSEWNNDHLNSIIRLQNLRVKLAGNGDAQGKLDQAFQAFVQNNPAQANTIMNSVGVQFKRVPNLDITEAGVRYDHTGSLNGHQVPHQLHGAQSKAVALKEHAISSLSEAASVQLDPQACVDKCSGSQGVCYLLCSPNFCSASAPTSVCCATCHALNKVCLNLCEL